MDEPGELNVLEELKNKLDSELDTCQRYQILQLMKRHLGPVYGEFLAREDDWSPSELLDYLENNMLESQALTILSHIFSEMRLHNTTTYEPFIDYINKYFEAKGCFYHDDLIGRKKELEDIKMEIGTRKGVWVYGQGGLGKTTLVNEVCTRMKNVKKTLVKKVNLKQTQFLSTMMKLIIKQFNASFNEDVEEDLSIETVTVCLKETLNKEGRDLLLFLDNVENVYEREKEFPATINSLLRIHKNVKWIMTSRLPFESSEEDLRHYNLGPLSSMDAQTLLRLYCRPKSLAPCHANVVLRKCGNVPLAIKTVAVALANDESYNPLKSEKELEQLLCMSIISTLECLEYAYAKLHNASKTFLRMLAICGTIPIDMQCVVAILNLSLKDSNRLMSELVTRQFVQPEPPAPSNLLFDNKGVRYSLQPLIAHFLTYRAQNVEHEEIINAKENLCKYLQKKLNCLDGKVHKSYSQVVTAVQQNSAIIQLFFETSLSIEVELQRNKSFHDVLVQLLDLLKMPPQDKFRFFKKFSERFLALNDYFLYCYWQLEALKGCLIAKIFKEAFLLSTDIEYHLLLITNQGMQKSIKVDLDFQHIRLLRLTEPIVNETAIIENLDSSLHMCNELEGNDSSIAVLMSMIVNLKGSVCFDVHKYDEAYAYHSNAVNILQKYIGNSDHPYLTIYEFNIGTVLFQKAEILLQDDICINEKQKTYYLEALEIFTKLIERDRVMGRHVRPQFEAKLSYRAKLFERLLRFKDALDDRDGVLDLLKDNSKSDASVTDAYFMKAFTLDSWIKEIPFGEERKQKLQQQINALKKVHECILNKGPLSEKHKPNFLRMYRRIANNVLTEKSAIEDFCNRYESNRHLYSDSDSDTSESDSQYDSSSNNSNADSGTEEPMNINMALLCMPPASGSRKRSHEDSDSESVDSPRRS